MRASGMTSSNSGGGIADDDDEDPKVATTRGSAALPRWLITFGFSTVVGFVIGSGCVVVFFVVRGVRSVVVSVESGYGVIVFVVRGGRSVVVSVESECVVVISGSSLSAHPSKYFAPDKLPLLT
jgi:hypothetical protein